MIVTKYKVENKAVSAVARGVGLVSNIGISLITGYTLGGAIVSISAINPLFGVCAYIGATSLSTLLGKRSAEAVKDTVETAAGEILGLEKVDVEL